jgi:two-component system nitrate/nitrite sensor histidine kinase NarX
MMPFTSYRNLAILYVPWAVVTVVMVTFSWIVSWWRGFRPARFLVLSWFFLFAALLLIMMVRLGVASSTIFSENAYLIGFVIVAVGMSFALADRINLLQSEKEEANLELSASESRFRQLVETMNDGLGVVDEEGRFTYVNKRLAEMIALSPDDLSGHLVTEFLGQDNQQVMISQLELRKTGASDPYELTWQKKDGSLILTNLSPVPLYDHGGQYKGSFAVITDITEKVLAGRLLEQKVEERTHELSTLLEISHDIISTEDLAVVLNRILERLKTVLDFHRLTILAEQKGKWRILAQDCPCSEADPEDFGLSDREVQALVNIFDSGEPFLIENADQVETDSNGFGKIITRISKGCAVNIRCWLGVPLLERGSVLGSLVIGCEEADVSDDQVKIVLAAANQVALAIENNRLYHQIRESVIVDERNRLARELHDSVTQTLFTASVLAGATPRMWYINKDLAVQNMDKLGLLIRGALAEMRSMLIELRSGDLGDQSLDQLLNTLGEAIQARIHAQISMSFMEIPELPPDVIFAFYRIAREALNNVLVHADAARVDISLIKENGRIELQIQDDGRGFDPGVIPTGHLGIRIMEERAVEIGGHLRILSEPGRGTDVVFTWSGKPGEPDE